MLETFRERWQEDEKKSVVTKVGEKTWHDWRCVGLFSGKADNRPCRTFGSRKLQLRATIVEWYCRINMSDAERRLTVFE